jgi:hypothetical protein
MNVAARLLISACIAAALVAAAGGPRPTPKYTVEGHVAGLGPSHRAALDFSSPGKPQRRVTTQGDGTYILRNVAPASYSVRPSHAGYSFSPSFRTVAVTNHDRTDIDFTAHPLPHRR